MELSTAAGALGALAHEGRLAAFRLLVQAGPEGLAAGEIARRLDVRPNTLSASLTILSHAGLVRSRRDGRSIIYDANYDAMRGLLGFLVEDCCGGKAEICAPLVANASPCCDAEGLAGALMSETNPQRRDEIGEAQVAPRAAGE